MTFQNTAFFFLAAGCIVCSMLVEASELLRGSRHLKKVKAPPTCTNETVGAVLDCISSDDDVTVEELFSKAGMKCAKIYKGYFYTADFVDCTGISGTSFHKSVMLATGSGSYANKACECMDLFP